MSNRKIVSDHMMIRWLERAEQVPMGVMRAACARVGYDPSSERDLLEFITVYSTYDVAAIRRELMGIVHNGLTRRAIAVRHKGYRICLRDNNGITVIPYGNRERATRAAQRGEVFA